MQAPGSPTQAPLVFQPAAAGIWRGTLTGRLDSNTVGPPWRAALAFLEQEHPARVELDCAQVTYCDLSGIGFLLDLRRRQEARGAALQLDHFPDQYRHLFDLLPGVAGLPAAAGRLCLPCLADELGQATVQLGRDVKAQVEFIGELAAALGDVAAHPGRSRWREMLRILEATSVNALPIIAMVGFLLGLILAFQAAIPMTQFGASIFVANLVALSLVRELGPLVTAIIFAGRSGAAFAAELGTMKVNDEINALVTMGINPVRHLVVPRVLAGLVATPLLSIFATLFGLIGAAIVVRTLGFPLVTYVTRVTSSVGLSDLFGGLFKAVVFGGLISGVGCLRGLQTLAGAQAVGVSTTRSVVSGLVLIIVADGLFAVMFYYLGW